MHELEFNVKLLENFGIRDKIEKGKVNFNLKVEENEDSERLINQIVKKKKSLVIIHPGSGGSAIDLPAEKFKELVLKLDKSAEVEIIITGSQTEKELCKSLVVSEKTHNMAGRFDLGGLTALINKADIFVANSTGPIHIAAAIGKNTIGFFARLEEPFFRIIYLNY